jgi:hypothetical protein
MRHWLTAPLISALLVLALPVGAATDKFFTHVRGTTGIAATKDGAVTPVTGQIAVNDDNFAITRDESNGLLTFPDSSEIALGPNTSVQVGGFSTVQGEGGAKITLVQGTMRFNVRHSTGAHANYTFITPTSNIAVRGTIALVSAALNGDTIACLACAAGDVNVIVGAQHFALLTGQALSVSAAGAVTAGAVAAGALQPFAGAGLSTSASSASGFASGVGSTTAATGASSSAAAGSASTGAASGAAAGAAGTTTAVAAGAAAAAAGAAAAVSNSNPTPAPSPSGTLNLSSEKKKH